MNRIAKHFLVMTLVVALFIPTVVSYACDPICPNVTKTDKCPYCSKYTPCCDAWSKCKNPERVIGMQRGSRTKDIAEFPMCAVLHKKETDYKKVSIINDTDQTITVRMHYSLPLLGGHFHTVRELSPGATYDFKYDKYAMIQKKYVEINGHRQKVNHGQVVKVTELS